MSLKQVIVESVLLQISVEHEPYKLVVFSLVSFRT